MPNYETNPDILRKDAEFHADLAAGVRNRSTHTGIIEALRAIQLEIRAASLDLQRSIDSGAENILIVGDKV